MSPPDPPPERACAQCGLPLPERMPYGWCPVCLLERVSTAFSRVGRPEPGLGDLDREFDGRYQFVRFIERGASGVVYHAIDLAGSRDVAIKILAEEIIATHEIRARFEAEAAAMQRLDHPNIVRMLDSGVTARGLPYLVMELVDGCDLRSLCVERLMDPFEAYGWFTAVCEAIIHAHSLGVLHLDLKPSNILIDGEGRVRVTDFGISRVVAPLPDAGATLGTIGAGPGWTFGYSAPEQIAGRRVDERSDIYALGALLYGLLTGHVPVGAWKKPGDCIAGGASLDPVIERALQGDPEFRYASVKEFHADLAKAMAAMAENPGPRSPGHRFRRSVLVVLAGLAIAGLASLWVHRDGRGQTLAARNGTEIVDSLQVQYRLKDDGTAMVTGYLGVRDTLDIPAMIEGHRVTGIAEGAFRTNRRIRQVRLAEGIEDIGSYAFKWCPELRSIQLPSSLRIIWPWAFHGCPNLEQPVLPEGLARLGEGAFADCPRFIRFAIPSSLGFLERYAFQNCKGIREVTIPATVDSMEGGVFAGCTQLEAFRIAEPHPTLRVVDGVIFGKNGTRLVHFPPGRYQAYQVSETTRIIGARAFYGCHNLLEVTLPEGLRTIETQAFIQCHSLESVDVPASVEHVMDGVFSNCIALRAVRIHGPGTVVDPEQIEKLGTVLQRITAGGR